MRDMLEYLVCAFWGHKWERIKVPVIKTQYQDTANYQEICKRCGEITEAYGVTHLGLFHVEIPRKSNQQG